MYEDTKVSQLVINQLSEEKFKELLENDELDQNQLYMTDDRAGYTPPLLSTLWSDHLLNDISWLRADTFSWQSGDVYVAAYNHLATDFEGTTAETETIGNIEITFYRAEDGHKICLPDQEDKILSLYNATGVAWYYILDTANKQFKLPRSKHNKYADTVPVVGNGMALGITNGQISRAIGAVTVHDSQTTTALMLSRNEPNNLAVDSSVTIKNSSGNDLGTGKAYGVATTPDSSGLIAQQEQDTDQYKYLYFYVGNFEKDAIEQAAGLNAELFNQKMDNGTPLIRDIFSPEEWENESMEQILSAGAGSGTLTFAKNWQEYDYLWFSSVSDGSNTLDDSPHWVNVKWMLAQAKAGVTNLAVVRYSSGAYWYVNPQIWTETTMPVGSASEGLYINRVYAIKLKNITAQNVGLLNYKGLFETAAALVATVPTAMGQWAIVSNDETQGGLQTKYFSTKDVNGNFVWAFGGVIDSSLVGADYVVESQLPTVENGYTWYRKYKSGWVEQGGRATTVAGQITPYTLPVVMANTEYTITATAHLMHTGNASSVNFASIDTTSFSAWSNIFGATGYHAVPFSWFVSGMSAQ